MNLLDKYSDFKSIAPVGLDNLRQSGLVFLENSGLPSRKNENWKYTSTKNIQEASYVPALLEHSQPSHELLSEVKATLNSEFINLVFINGAYNNILSTSLPAGVSLEGCLNIEAHSSTQFEDGYDALNAAYTERLWRLQVLKNTSVDKVVNIVHYISKTAAIMVHSRLHVEVGSGAKLSLIETFSGRGNYFSNSVTKVFADENSKVSFVNLQSESMESSSIARTLFELSTGATLECLSFACGSLLGRHNLVVNFNGELASAIVNGVTVAKHKQHIDHNTSIQHNVGNCTSKQLYKNILDNEAHGIFNGRVFIAKNAQKAYSEQLNNNLLLSRKAEASSKPVLEIYADDVKATHGSTVGQLSDEELFYLESRAISKEIAISMLSYGFLAAVISSVEDLSTQAWLKKYLDRAFAGLKAGG